MAASATWYRVDRTVIYIYINNINGNKYIYKRIIMYKYIHISRRNFEAGSMEVWMLLRFTEDITTSSIRRTVFWSEFYRVLCSKAKCVLFIYFKAMPFIKHLGSVQLLHRDKKYNMEYNGVSNWRELCQPCLPSPLVGFVWDTISGVTMGLPFHCRDPLMHSYPAWKMPA